MRTKEEAIRGSASHLMKIGEWKGCYKILYKLTSWFLNNFCWTE